MNIQWITINVSSLDESRNFYSGFLGLHLKNAFSPNDKMSIEFYEADNGMQIELIESGNIKATQINTSGVSIGIATQNYKELLSIAKEKNILTGEPRNMGNMECFFVNDPNNIGIQIIKG